MQPVSGPPYRPWALTALSVARHATDHRSSASSKVSPSRVIGARRGCRDCDRERESHVGLSYRKPDVMLSRVDGAERLRRIGLARSEMAGTWHLAVPHVAGRALAPCTHTRCVGAVRFHRPGAPVVAFAAGVHVRLTSIVFRADEIVAGMSISPHRARRLRGVPPLPVDDVAT